MRTTQRQRDMLDEAVLAEASGRRFGGITARALARMVRISRQNEWPAVHRVATLARVNASLKRLMAAGKVYVHDSDGYCGARRFKARRDQPTPTPAPEPAPQPEASPMENAEAAAIQFAAHKALETKFAKLHAVAVRQVGLLAEARNVLAVAATADDSTRPLAVSTANRMIADIDAHLGTRPERTSDQ